MGKQLQKEILWVKRIQRFGVPLLVVYVTSLVVSLFFERMLLIPLMWTVAVFLVVMGHQQYRILRQFSTRPKGLQWLKIEYADTWISAILMGTFMTTLLTTESFGFLIGGVFGIWGLTESYRKRLIVRKLKAYDPDMPTYDQVIERMKP
ncbi:MULTISPECIES: hypothetical protein [unclassified Exiguobacterium]|uniref:hypothetical protein n=1 Tax=unclassified Exiguobacterium TaxID=2644629 RepID=UPI00103A8EE0|nr:MULTISPECIES: hypothetical protein [unclassified Exiguobacterium]TCI34028.1 hypothetical protein EVJ29_12435 [Exiguobacterium sp. SH4S7]TCI59424.1 hypothetical protein EVJ21_13880 [Exiguobacterium sp. SH0S2]